jgi:hypothetical protein
MNNSGSCLPDATPIDAVIPSSSVSQQPDRGLVGLLIDRGRQFLQDVLCNDLAAIFIKVAERIDVKRLLELKERHRLIQKPHSSFRQAFARFDKPRIRRSSNSGVGFMIGNAVPLLSRMQFLRTFQILIRGKDMNIDRIESPAEFMHLQ